MDTTKIQAVIFDLDGVITDSAEFHYMAWKELADKLNIPFDKEHNEKLKGVSRMESLEFILEGSDKTFSQSEKETFAHEKNERYKELINTITPNDTLPNIKEFLIELKSHNIKTAVASVSKNVNTIINKLNLGEYFDYIVDANEIKNTKPHPEVFLKAAYALGVEPKNCIGIEDAKAGIAAINAAGMKSIGVGTPEQMQDADLILLSTKELNLNKISNL